MAYSLVGTVVSSCDTAADFTTINGGANISGDDDFVEGTGAVGDKMSNTTEILASDTLSGGVAGVYDFSVGGADEGAHFIGWVNTKTPVNATSGIAVYFGNGTDTGTANVMPASFYKGGFVTRVWNPAADFDTASGWTTTGNPAQLDDVSEMGFEFTTITSIMGSFNNTQVDQFTVGFGVRADAGTSGVPNDFAGVINFDEGTNFYGWWSVSNGANVGKGKLYLGPATGDVASWFVDSAFSVNFADENVASGFYEFDMRGGNTTVDWTLANISAANPTNARWSVTVDTGMGATTGGFTDNTGTWTGSDAVTLNANATLDGTTIINGVSLVQNSAVLTGITVIEPSVLANVAYATSDDPELITDCEFNANSGNTGHAIEITTAGVYDFDGNSFPGFTTTGAGSNLVASTGPSNAMIYNNSGGAVTLNIIGGGQNVVVRNGASSTTTVNLSVPVVVTVVDADTGDPIQGANVVLGTTLGDVDVIDNVLTDVNGEVSTSFSGTTPQDVFGYVAKGTRSPVYKRANIVGSIGTTGYDQVISLVSDE